MLADARRLAGGLANWKGLPPGQRDELAAETADTISRAISRLGGIATPEDEINAQRALAHEEIANDVLGWLKDRGLYDPRDYEHEGLNVADTLASRDIGPTARI